MAKSNQTSQENANFSSMDNVNYATANSICTSRGMRLISTRDEFHLLFDNRSSQGIPNEPTTLFWSDLTGCSGPN